MAKALSDNFFIENLLGLKEEKRATWPSSTRKAQKHPTSEQPTNLIALSICN